MKQLKFHELLDTQALGAHTGFFSGWWGQWPSCQLLRPWQGLGQATGKSAILVLLTCQASVFLARQRQDNGRRCPTALGLHARPELHPNL